MLDFLPCAPDLDRDILHLAYTGWAKFIAASLQLGNLFFRPIHSKRKLLIFESKAKNFYLYSIQVSFETKSFL